MNSQIAKSAPDLLSAAQAVLRMHLDNVSVHPCDEHNDKVRAAGCVTEVQQLYSAVEHARAAQVGSIGEQLAAAIEQRFQPKGSDLVGCGTGYAQAISDIVRALRAGELTA